MKGTSSLYLYACIYANRCAIKPARLTKHRSLSLLTCFLVCVHKVCLAKGRMVMMQKDQRMKKTDVQVKIAVCARSVW